MRRPGSGGTLDSSTDGATAAASTRFPRTADELVARLGELYDLEQAYLVIPMNRVAISDENLDVAGGEDYWCFHGGVL